jgi:hypothetical protein
MKKPTKKELYEKVKELQAKEIEMQEEKERQFTEKAMVYYDGAYNILVSKLRNSFGGAYCLIKLDHIDTAGFWFSFELVNDKRRQTYRVNHDDAKKEYIKKGWM